MGDGVQYQGRKVRTEREGRVLRVTLWPNLMKGEPDQAVEDLPEPQIECIDITRIASSEDNEVSVIMEALERTVEDTSVIPLPT